MKWVGLIAVLAAILPVSGWLRRNPSETPKAWMLMGFLPFALAPFHLYMAAVSWGEWPGYVKGAEFSVLDALVLALYLSSPGAQRPIPFRLSMVLYFLAALLSVTQADVPMAALFYPWQLARMFLVYAVVARSSNDPRVVPAVLKGLAAGLFMEAGLVIWQRFVLGMLQTPGTFIHQNILGLASHFIVFPFFAMFLTRGREWLPTLVLVTGILVEILTISRATIGLAGAGYVLMFTLSALRQWTPRKARTLLVGAMVALIVAPLAIASIDRRSSGELESSNNERVALESAATTMLSDHPMGVGANNYVLVANVGGYNQRAGVAPVEGSASAEVHNIYLLVASETGYLGLVTFVFLLIRPLTVAFLCGWRHRRDPRGDLLLGLGISMLLVYVHSFFEWNFITFEVQYVYALVVGLVASLALQLGYWREPYRRTVLPTRVLVKEVGEGRAASSRTTTFALPVVNTPPADR